MKYQNWLKSGPQTKITSQIQGIASKFNSGTKFETLREVLGWLHETLIRDESKKDNLFRKRSADDILTDKFATGCTDFNIAYIAIARAIGWPTKYIEGVRKERSKNYFEGHVIAESFIRGKWIGVDPSYSEIYLNPEQSRFYKEHRIIGVGLDSWDLGVYGLNDLIALAKSYGFCDRMQDKK